MTAASDPLPPAPFVEELQPAPEAVEVFRRLAAQPRVVFFDSALRDERLGRYSFVACDPFDTLALPRQASPPYDVASDGFSELRRRLAPFKANRHRELPPFQGGTAGLFGYELGRRLERVASAAYDEFQTPPLEVGLYDVVVAFDHLLDRAWIISQGFPETDPVRRADRAAMRGRQMLEWLRADAPLRSMTPDNVLPADRLAPQFPMPRLANLSSNFSREGYLRTIARTIEYIHAGDIFQANIAQRLLLPAGDDPVALYLRLRERNAAPFAGFFDLGPFQIASASPERLLCVVDGAVEARPIKGTRSRSDLPEADLFAQDDLQLSEKDRAENVMIVDLLRNDLSKYCRPESVRVARLCAVEVYRYVQHLVSVVEGRLAPGADALDVLRGAFPGGSITGAPKVRAMQIIAEQEPTARGPYCGSLAYLGFDGTLDANILIRTITAGRGWWQAPVGGGITANSVPEQEYEETWHKAEGLLRAME